MKTLSIQQPHSDLIVWWDKSIENRTWRTRHRGPILIHASSRLDRDEVTELSGDGWDILAESPCVMSAIVGVATVLDVLDVEAIEDWIDGGDNPCSTPAAAAELERAADAGELERYAFGPFCWLLGDRKPIPDPVPCGGKLNLWTPPPSVLRAINRQL